MRTSTPDPAPSQIVEISANGVTGTLTLSFKSLSESEQDFAFSNQHGAEFAVGFPGPYYLVVWLCVFCFLLCSSSTLYTEHIYYVYVNLFISCVF